MFKHPKRRIACRRHVLACAAVSSLSMLAWDAMAQQMPSDDEVQQLREVTVSATAEEQLRQSLGVSVITEEDLQERPPANDLAEILRTQPGVNLSGNGSSGTYGNQRQIDLRGMGPENTLVLIDGKPVLSRNGAQMRRGGERDTSGDTNWVPVDQIERIEVIRGPAAARYGSGAAGGVVNIITKRPGDKLSGGVTLYASSEKGGGDTRRLGFNLSGPLSERLSFRMYGNVAKTGADNVDTNLKEDGSFAAAGREGRRNRDLNGTLIWQLTPEQLLEFQGGFSRQGSIYSGESVTGVIDPEGTSAGAELIGQEVRRTYRQTASVTHKGQWGELGRSRVIFQYEGTRTANCQKGQAGAVDGNCNATDVFPTSTLKNYFLNGELYTPLRLGGLDQVLTTGIEYRQEKLDDQANIAAWDREMGKISTWALYLEDNIGIGEALMLTPGVRFDHHEQFGNNWSPSLNAVYELSPQWSLKGGVARVFKAPNLYQINPGYRWNSRGNGCNGMGPCGILGNSDLAPEISLNKEIGLAWESHQGWNASLAYFRNDYKNKIGTDLSYLEYDPVNSQFVTRWMNSGKALIHGLEGSFTVPLLGQGGRTLRLINNYTVMFSNKSKETGQPVSTLPHHTLNSTLDWRMNEKFSAQLQATHYGKQKPRTLSASNSDVPVTGTGLEGLGSYTLFHLSGSYAFNKNSRLSFGVTNLFDKSIQRKSNQSSSAGAATYNEPGRGIYVSYNASF